MIERDGTPALSPVDDTGWPKDLEERLSPLADLKVPARE